MLTNRFLSLTLLLTLCFPIATLADNQPDYIKPTIHIEHWKTQDQVPVYFVAVKELPIIDIILVADAGSARDGEKPGLAYLTNKMLIETTVSASKQDTFKLADLGALLSKSIDRDKAQLHLRSTTNPSELKLALQIFKTSLTSPAFTERNLQQQQQRLRSKLQKEQDTPRDKGKAALLASIYAHHPYAHSPLGTEKKVLSITLSDIENFYQRYYTRGNIMIAIVGHLDRQQAVSIAEDLGHAFKAGIAAPIIPPATTALATPLLQRIAHPSNQAHLYLGQIGVAPMEADFFPLLVGNQILGGGALISRLGNEIRLKRGLAYNVSSRFIPWQAKGPFIINIQTHHSQADTVLHLAQEVLLKFVKQGPNPQELAAAKQKLIGNIPLLFDSNEKIITQLVNIGRYQLPLDYFNTVQDKINAVTLEQVKTTFQQRIHPSHLAITITGGNQVRTQ